DVPVHQLLRRVEPLRIGTVLGQGVDALRPQLLRREMGRRDLPHVAAPPPQADAPAVSFSSALHLRRGGGARPPPPPPPHPPSPPELCRQSRRSERWSMQRVTDPRLAFITPTRPRSGSRTARGQPSERSRSHARNAAVASL